MADFPPCAIEWQDLSSVWNAILHCRDPGTLSCIIRTNSFFLCLGLPILYRDAFLCDALTIDDCLEMMRRVEVVQAAVRSFTVRTITTAPSERLLADVLIKLSCVTSVSINVSVLDKFPAHCVLPTLTALSLSVEFNQALSDFVEHHAPRLEFLHISGPFQGGVVVKGKFDMLSTLRGPPAMITYCLGLERRAFPRLSALEVVYASHGLGVPAERQGEKELMVLIGQRNGSGIGVVCLTVERDGLNYDFLPLLQCLSHCESIKLTGWVTHMCLASSIAMGDGMQMPANLTGVVVELLSELPLLVRFEWSYVGSEKYSFRLGCRLVRHIGMRCPKLKFCQLPGGGSWARLTEDIWIPERGGCRFAQHISDRSYPSLHQLAQYLWQYLLADTELERRLRENFEGPNVSFVPTQLARLFVSTSPVMDTIMEVDRGLGGYCSESDDGSDLDEDEDVRYLAAKTFVDMGSYIGFWSSDDGRF